MSTKIFGMPVLRREDPRLVRGGGRYLDDLRFPDMAHVVFVRSSYASAIIRSINVDAASVMPGVLKVVSSTDMGPAGGPFPLLLPHKGLKVATWGALAAERVRFVGEPVVAVIAETHSAALDGAEAVEIQYDPLPAVVDIEAAVKPGSPLVHEGISENVSMRFFQKVGDVDAALRSAPHSFKKRLRVCRGAGMPLETRGVIASRDSHTGELTVWSSTQEPHTVRDTISAMLEVAPRTVRVLSPDAGGGFGTKLNVYPEEVFVPWAAVAIGRPVKWAETRSEHMLTAQQERDQIHDVELGFDDDGRILAMKDRFLHDTGAYAPRGGAVPCNTSSALPGPYRIPNMEFEVVSVHTNKVTVSAYRGAGQPQASFVMERLVDQVARVLDKDPAEVRRINTIPNNCFPYNTGLTNLLGGAVEYDSGLFQGTLEQALEGADYKALREEQKRARLEGRLFGIGIGSYVELTGRGPWEGGGVRIEPDGKVTVYTGASSQGQGHHTTFAQVCAEHLGVTMDQVTVVSGDTALIPFGIGTFASRVGVLTGNAVREAAIEVKIRVLKVAQELLDEPAEDLDIIDGEVQIKGAGGNRKATLADIAKSVVLSRKLDPEAASLDVTRYFKGPKITYTNGTHVAAVEVDPDTGHIKILRYVISHDCGRMINPMIVEGQIQGGVVCGLGNAFLEQHVHSDDGQLLTGSFMDYAMPRAIDIPKLEIFHQECPATLNPLGMRGAGEAGTIPVPATICGAVEDALKPFGIEISEAPLTPFRLWRIIADHQATQANSPAKVA